MQSAKTASLLAAATAVVFLLLMTIVHLNGISQQYFEMVRPPEKYTEELTEHSQALHIIFVLDNIFILLYSCSALFAIYTWRANGPAFISLLSGGLVVAIALLDYLENFHIYSLMQQAKQGIAVSAADIRWQSVESMMKWHIAYTAFFLIGFLIPGKDVLSKSFKYSLWGWFVVTGVLVYAVVGTSYAALFQWIRYINLFTGFVLISILMRREQKTTV